MLGRANVMGVFGKWRFAKRSFARGEDNTSLDALRAFLLISGVAVPTTLVSRRANAVRIRWVSVLALLGFACWITVALSSFQVVVTIAAEATLVVDTNMRGVRRNLLVTL